MPRAGDCCGAGGNENQSGNASGHKFQNHHAQDDTPHEKNINPTTLTSCPPTETANKLFVEIS